MEIIRKYGVATTAYLPLIADGSASFQANPTLAAGDVTISKDGGAFANLTTLPTVTPASGRQVKVSLSATEMQCKEALIVFVDVSGAEWEDQAIAIVTCGHASAELPFDLGTAEVLVDMTQSLPASPTADTIGEALKGQTWPMYNVVDLTNDGGDSNPVDNGDGTMSFDTDLTWTNDISSTTPKPIMYFPTTGEDARQDANCNVQGERAEVTAYNTTTKVITVKSLSALPDYRSLFRFY